MSRDFVRRVLVVEDEALLRALLKSTLETHGFEVETAPDAVIANRTVKTFDPDVMVVDIDLGEGLNGLELVSALGRQDSTRGYVILSNYSANVKNVPEVPHISYLNKQVVETPELLISEIEGVLRGRASDFEVADSPKLTPAQIDILRMLSEGMTNKQIANTKNQSLRAVEQLIARTYSVLGYEKKNGQSRRILAVQFYKQLMKINR